jgi:hypothetical protein
VLFILFAAKSQKPSKTALFKQFSVKLCLMVLEGSGANLLRLYRLLLRKYSEHINEQEKRTIGDIKALVNKEDLTVQSIILDLKPENYSFEENFLQAAKACYDFVCKEIDFAKADIDISFWLSPKDILENKVADDEDLAVLMCSLLFALGDEKAQVVIVELESLSTHAFVVTEFKDKFLLLDASQKEPFEKFLGRKEKVLSDYSFEGSKIKRVLYRFNGQNYEQFF